MEKSPAFGCRRWGFESTHFLERMIAVKDGFVRVAAATPRVSVANVEENARRVGDMFSNIIFHIHIKKIITCVVIAK